MSFDFQRGLSINKAVLSRPKKSDQSPTGTNQFLQSFSRNENELESYQFQRSKINYLDSELFVQNPEGIITNQNTSTTHVFKNMNTKEEVHVSGLAPEYAKDIHCIHRFYRTANSHFFFAFWQSWFLIVEAGRVVLAKKFGDEQQLDQKKGRPNRINDVKFREGNTEYNNNFFYFIISTDHCVNIVKWERTHKDVLKDVVKIDRDKKKALQTSLIRELLSV